MRKLSNIIAIILLAIFLPILVINCIFIVKSYIHPDEIPFVLGTATFAVAEGSMSGTIEGGDLVFCRAVEAEEVEVGDIITFIDPMGNGKSLVIHRVIGISEQDGKRLFTTKGDANISRDMKPVPEENVVAIYTGRIKGLGRVAQFMQTTVGLLLFVVTPLLAFIIIDSIRLRRIEKEREKATTELSAKIEALEEERAKTVYN